MLTFQCLFDRPTEATGLPEANGPPEVHGPRGHCPPLYRLSAALTTPSLLLLTTTFKILVKATLYANREKTKF